VVNELPLDDALANGGHLIFRVGEEVVTDALTALTVANVLQHPCQRQRLHEEGSADHVVVVELAPAAVAVLVAEQSLVMQDHGVLG